MRKGLDKNEIFRAARDAEEIANHIIGLAINAPQQEKVPTAPTASIASPAHEMTRVPVAGLESIRRMDFKDEERNAIQETIARTVEANPDTFINRFKALPQSLNGRFISADTFKETFEPYRESNESRNLFNAPLHNSAAVLASEQLRRVLQERPEVGRDYVVLLTGVPGAGKTSSVLKDDRLPEHIHAVYEGQLADPKNAIAKVQQVLNAGFKPIIVVAHALPEKALDNTLQRFEEVGRGASINVMAKIQAGLPEGLAAVYAMFGDAVELRITDRRDFLHPTRIKGWQHLSTLESEGDHEHIKQRLEQHLEHRKSELSPDAWRQAAGFAPLPKQRGNSGRDSGHTDTQHDRLIDRRGAAQENRYDARVSAPTSQSPQKAPPRPLASESDKVAAALSYLSPDNREFWVKMAMAVKNGLGENGFTLWDNWSQGADNYRAANALDVWKSVKTSGRGIDLGTLYFEAKKYGFKPGEWRTQDAPSQNNSQREIEREAQRAIDAAKADAKYQAAAKKALEVFRLATPIDPSQSNHPYLLKKGVADFNVVHADNNRASPRVLSASALKAKLGYTPKADGVPLSGQVLICPVENGIGLCTLEFIDEQGRKSALAGGKKSGAWYSPSIRRPLEPLTLPTVIVEGIATAMSVHEGLNLPGQPPKAYVVAALSDTNLKNVAKELKALRPNSSIIIGADANSIRKAKDAATEVGGRFMFPSFDQEARLDGKAPTDFNDLMSLMKAQGQDFGAEMQAVFNREIAAPKAPTEPVLPAVVVSNLSTNMEIQMENNQTVTKETSTETAPKKFTRQPIGEPIFKPSDLPAELTAHIKDRFGSRAAISTPRENGVYKGEVYDTRTHLVQSVSASAVVVHDKSQMEFVDSIQKANNDNKLSGWELGIYYEGNKPLAFPHDSKKEAFTLAAKQIKAQFPEQEKGAFDEKAKAACAQVITKRQETLAKAKQKGAPEKAQEVKTEAPATPKR